MESSDSESEGHSMWSRPFTFGSTQIRVEEEWGLGIGGTVWEGGVLLAHYLSNAFPRDEYKGARCIEIGAGITGLPSLAVAHHLQASEIIVTDIEECVEALRENLATNLPANCQLESLPSASCSNPKTQQTGAVIDGWDVPASVLETVKQDSPRKFQLGDQHKAQAALQSLSLNGTSSSNGEKCQSTEQASSCQTQSSYNTSSSPAVASAPQQLPGSVEDAGSHGQQGACNLQENSKKETASPSQIDENIHRRAEVGDLSHSHEKPRDQSAAHRSDAGASTFKELDSTCQKVSVKVGALDWRESVQHLSPPFDLVLVADVVYIAELMAPLLECVHSLSGPETLVIFAYYERSATASAKFFELLPNYYRATKIREDTFGLKAQPGDVGLFKLTRV